MSIDSSTVCQYTDSGRPYAVIGFGEGIEMCASIIGHWLSEAGLSIGFTAYGTSGTFSKPSRFCDSYMLSEVPTLFDRTSGIGVEIFLETTDPHYYVSQEVPFNHMHIGERHNRFVLVGRNTASQQLVDAIVRWFSGKRGLKAHVCERQLTDDHPAQEHRIHQGKAA